MKKRIISTALAAVMALSSLMGLSVSAENGTVSNVKISGRYDTNVPVYVSYDGDGTIAWQYADSKDAQTWTTVSGATSSTWIPGRGHGGKWIRAVVTPTGGGEAVTSEPKQMNKTWVSKSTGAPTGAYIGTTPADSNNGALYYVDATGMVRYPEVTTYQFTVDGQKFVLLDTTEDENSHFLVVSQHTIGSRKLADGGQILYDVMGWLNDKDTVVTKQDQKDRSNSTSLGYGTSGGYRAYCASDTEDDFIKLPKAILDGIDEDAIWKTEPKMWEWGNNEVSYQGGISIPAWTEYEKYAGKVSLFYFMPDGSKDGNMWTRTPQGNQGDGNSVMNYNTTWHLNNLYSTTSSTALELRPIFYLKRDFFLNNKLDLENVNDEIRNTIIKEYTRDELVTAGYDGNVVDKYKDEGGELTVNGISGEVETSLPVTVNYNYAGNRKVLTFKLLSSDTEDGDFAVTATQTANATFTIPVSLSNKYVKFSVENILGDVKYTDVYKVGEAWGRETGIATDKLDGKDSVDLTSSKGDTLTMRVLSTINATTPKEYTFKVTNDNDRGNDMEFILLDTKRDDEAKFLVMTKNNVGTRKLEEDRFFGSTIKFLNSEDTYEDTGYTTGKSGLKLLPTSVLGAIDTDHVWKLECGMWDNAESTVTGGIVIPAAHEIREYSEKIGLRDDGVSWWTRTPYGLSGSASTSVFVTGTDNIGANLGTMWSAAGNSAERGIRPMFYLNKRFFTDNHIPLADMGEETLNAIRKVYTRSELSNAGYSEEELSTYYDVNVGTLSSVSVKGLVSDLGETLNADTRTTLSVDMKYTGSANSYSVAWYIADTADGEYSMISGSKGQTSIEIPDSYAGKYVKATVTLKDESGTKKDSKPVRINDVYQKETAINTANAEAADKNGGFFTGGDNGLYEYRDLTGTVDTSPVKYTFTYDGREYVLLDRFNDDKSRYLVVAKKSLVSRELFDGGSQNIHLTFAWLNNTDDFKENGFRNSELYPNTLPQAIVSHINENAKWQVEPKMYDTAVTEFTGGIAVPSVTELRKYKDKMGIKDDARWWFRTPDGKKGDGRNMLVAGTELSIMGSWPGSGASAGIRPIFYLDSDFFNEVKVENMGTEVAKAVRGDVDRASLKKLGYTQMEIYHIMGGAEPSVKVTYSNSGNNSTANFTVNGYETGDKLTFIYAIYSEDESSLLSINMETAEITTDSSGVATQTVTIPNVPDGTAKVFVWEGSATDVNPSSVPVTVE